MPLPAVLPLVSALLLAALNGAWACQERNFGLRKCTLMRSKTCCSPLMLTTLDDECKQEIPHNESREAGEEKRRLEREDRRAIYGMNMRACVCNTGLRHGSSPMRFANMYLQPCDVKHVLKVVC